MREGQIHDYMAFQTEFERRGKNLERSGWANATEELIEKLAEECAT